MTSAKWRKRKQFIRNSRESLKRKILTKFKQKKRKKRTKFIKTYICYKRIYYLSFMRFYAQYIPDISGSNVMMKKMNDFYKWSMLNRYSIGAPIEFSMSNDGWQNQLLSFISEIARCVDKKIKIRLDFSLTKKMRPEGTLWFYANIDRFIVGKKADIRCSNPPDDIVRQVLNHLGFFGFFERTDKKLVSHKTVIHWINATGRSVNGEKLYEFKQFDNPETDNLYNALIEAVSNTIGHAYPVDYSDKRWWAFAQDSRMKEDDSEDTLFVCIADTGVGIPYTMRSEPENWEIALNFLDRLARWLTNQGLYIPSPLYNKDGHLIQAAFQIGRSRTKRPERGKGLPQMKDILDENEQGSLSIHSGSGYYSYNAHDGTEIVNSEYTFLPGTVITWILNIPRKQK